MKRTLLASIISFAILLSLSGSVVYAAQQGGSSGPLQGGSSGPIQGGPSGPIQGGPSGGTKILIDNPFRCGSQNCTLNDLMMAILDNLVIPIGGILCILAFIFAGFMYVTAQGNPGKISTAHKALLYAALGTALILGAKVFATVIENTVDKLKV